MKLTIGNTQLKEKRFKAASVVINDTVLWITGGMWNNLAPLDTTEFIELFFENATAGTPPKLPNITLHRFFLSYEKQKKQIFCHLRMAKIVHILHVKNFFWKSKLNRKRNQKNCDFDIFLFI